MSLLAGILALSCAGLLVYAVLLLERIVETVQSVRRLLSYVITRHEAKEDAIVEMANDYHEGPRQMLNSEWSGSFLRKHSMDDGCSQCGIDLKNARSIWHIPNTYAGWDGYCSLECAKPAWEAQRAAKLSKIGGRASNRLFRADMGWKLHEIDEAEKSDDKHAMQAYVDWTERRVKRTNPNFRERRE